METRVKRARVLSQNQITEIVIYSESDEENYACKELKPRPQCKSKNMYIYKFFLETYLLHYAIRKLQHFKGF